jgi:hypothetical protein
MSKKSCPFVRYGATLLQIFQRLLANPPADLLSGIRGYWQALGQLPQRVLALFAKRTYVFLRRLPYLLIIYQRVLITTS